MRNFVFLLTICCFSLFMFSCSDPKQESNKNEIKEPAAKKSDSVVKIVEFIKNPQNKNKFDSFKDSATTTSVTVKISIKPLRINIYNTDGKVISITQTINKERSWWNDYNLDGTVDFGKRVSTKDNTEERIFSRTVDTTIGILNESYWQIKYKNSLNEFCQKFNLKI